MKKYRFLLLLLCLALAVSLTACYHFEEEHSETSGTLDKVPLESMFPEESETPAPTPLEALYYDYSDYRNVLQNTVNEYEETMGGDYLPYALFDLDGDGVLELLVKTGTCEADYVWQVYTVGEMGAKSVGSFGGGHSGLYTDDQPGILCQYGQMGYEKVIRVTYDGQYLSTQTLTERQLSEGEDYSTPGERVATALISDPGLIP